MTNKGMEEPSFCIIPVRGGSKGIPRKNLAEFNGISLLEWTINQAMEVYRAEHIMVSTEDEEMAQVANVCGIRLINRPDELAQDSSTTNVVVDHLLAEVDPDGELFGHFTILQVTSPLRNAQDIEKAESMMQAGGYDSVISAYQEQKSHPAKMYQMQEGMAVSVAPEMEYMRRQDLPKIYRRNGAIFSCTREYYDRTDKLWGGNMGIVEMPRQRSVDVDASDDLELAREIFETLS
ncbi:MAG: acylneuraminate cytidylyltransferase family protein [Rickettsiales bacterium]|nr:acylneuraminate cytidylyltransferase family protein [Rickettsiales bacterium]